MQPITKRKEMLYTLLFTLFSYVVLVGEASAAGYGLDQTAKRAGGKDEESGIPFLTDGPSSIAGDIIGTALSFIGLLFFILMIYGGVMWMTAAGNQQQVDKAKSMITSAVVGLIIVMAAYAITSFIGSTLT